MNRRCIFYQDETDDVVRNAGQEIILPAHYRWILDRPKEKLQGSFLYSLAFLCAMCYARMFLRVKVVNRSCLKQAKGQGYFIFGNHTQPVGDALVPAWLNRERHIYAVCAPANLGIPVIGRWLPLLGALPVPQNLRDMNRLNQAIFQRIDEGHCIIIYPEAHVWPYYTKIRPFQTSSFTWPIDSSAPSFVMTTTYQKPRHGRKPQIVVYLDGPFYPDKTLPRREQKKKLHDQVAEQMAFRSRNSNYEYIKYKKKGINTI